MLTAINEETQETIFIDKWINNIGELRKLKLVDPLFFKPVFPRRPHFRKTAPVRGHFVSKTHLIEITEDNLLDDNDYFIRSEKGIYLNESFDHMEGKKYITTYVLDHVLTEYKELKFKYEYRVKIKNKNKYRIIDSAIFFPNGFILALECQLSAISEESLIERIRDYNSEGIESLWFLGKQADTTTNRNILHSFFGEVPPSIHF